MRIHWFFYPILTLLLHACSGNEGDLNQRAASGEETTVSSTGVFVELDPASTGIDVVNRVYGGQQFNHVNFPYMFNGAGVGVIDFDNDGLQDLYFVSNQDDNRLYRNTGGLKFEDVTEQSGTAGQGGFCTGVNIVDLDGDGFQDIYLSRTGVIDTEEALKSRENLFYRNNGDGTFTESAAALGINSDHPGTQSLFFDFDLDGDLDLYQVNTPIDFDNVNSIRAVQTSNGLERKKGAEFEWESDQLYRNDEGVFTEITEQAGITNRAFGLSAFAHDFNSDGLPDVYVANDYIDYDNVYINNGDGTFTENASGYLRHTSQNSMGADLADLNNDGLQDIVSLDMLAEPLQRQKEMENSMRPDRYNTMVRLGYGHQIMRNQLQLNNGTNFSEIGEMAGIAATDWSWAPLLADFDNDGNTDIFISNGYRYDFSNLDFVSYTVDSVMNAGGISSENFADFHDFLKLVPSFPQSNYLYRNRGDLQFENVAEQWNVGEPSYSSSAVYADFDNDGDLDLVVGNHERPPFFYQNQTVEKARGGSWLQLTASGGTGNTKGVGLEALLVVDDGMIRQTLHPARGFLGTSQAMLHFGLGDLDKVKRLEITWPDGKTQLLENVSVNQRLDVSYADAGSEKFSAAAAGAMFDYPQGQRGLDFRHLENDFNDFDRQFLQPRMLSREGPALAKADVNGDGREDLFFGGAAGSAAALYLQDARGRFARRSVFPPSDDIYEDVVAIFFDADGDGDPDLLVGSGGSYAAAGSARYSDRLYLNDKGTFTRADNAIPETSTSTGALVALDYDGDGDLDVVAGGRGLPGAYPTAPRSFLLRNNGGGTFEDVTEIVFPDLVNIGMVTALAAGDLLGDDGPELVVAGEWMPVTTYTFDGARFSAATDGPSAGAGFWHSLLITDLDGDGRNELIAGNDGLNTRFQPDRENKISLFAADFDRNGAIDPVVTFSDDRGRMVPVATKAMMIKQMPGLKKKYVRAKDYARADITDLFTADNLAGALRFDLETVSTTVIRRSGNGWINEALPRMAQTAPARAIRSADFNDDGLQDLLLLGNDYGLQVETGRVDAGNGTLLLNQGKGEWTVVPNHEHGFWASLDGRGLISVDLADGKTGWVIVNNNGPAAIYEQR